MITEKDLQEAIAECQGVRNPNANTCIKLAAFLTIQRELYGDKAEELPQSYSYAAIPDGPVGKITYQGDTEFSQEIYGRSTNEIIGIIDELMTALQVINPRLYEGVMRKVAE